MTLLTKRTNQLNEETAPRGNMYTNMYNPTAPATDRDRKVRLDLIGLVYANPKSYGAVGDGIADDTLAVQAAIDSGLPVWSPPGVFKITTTIELSQNDFIGSGAKLTVFDISGCDGFLVPLASSRISTQISNFSVYSLDENSQDYVAIKFEQDTGNTGMRSSGFKFNCLEIGSQGFEQFGAAFYITDAFRVGLTNIGINNCHNSLLIVGQVVQFSALNVYSNYDQQFSCAGFDGVESPATSYGIYVGGNDHTGTYQLPESIQVGHCGFVMHEVGLYNHDSLHARFMNTDFDFCRENGVQVYATNGFTLRDCYIAVTGNNATHKHGITVGTSAFEIKNLNIENNFITTYVGTTNADFAIYFNTDFREGGNIVANEIRAGDALSRWQWGIYMDKSKKFTISKNVFIPGSINVTDAIYCDSAEDFNITENYCGAKDITYTTGAGSFWVQNNICNDIHQTITGTAKGYSFQPQNVILKNANISSGLLQYDPSGVLKTGMIDTAVNFNTLIIPGEYANTHNSNNPNAGYGIYFVSVKRSAGLITQIAYPPVVDASPTDVKMYLRSSGDGGGTWTAWRQVSFL